MLDENAQQALPLVQPLLGLLSCDGDVPYQLVTRALSAILAPLPFEALKAMGLVPVMQQGLHSKIPDIQVLALEQAQKMTEVDDSMVSSLLDCLGDEDASVGKKTVDVIATVLSHVPCTLITVIFLRYISITIYETSTNSTNLRSNSSISRFNSLTNPTRRATFPKAIAPSQFYPRQYSRYRCSYDYEHHSILLSPRRSLSRPVNPVISRT